ncbi:MAG: NnrU family protein [Gammaproteobacteria bacterium]|nr:MAG: NnrU family protein [Gammaproteobacteria bacterium]
MTLLILGLLIFLGVHSIVIFAPNFRAKYRRKYLLTWKAVYGLIALVGFILIIIGYGQARLSPTFVYFLPYWSRHIVFLLMIPVFILFFAPYFPGMISKISRHPQLLAVKIWAGAHLLVNGTVADLCLFGSLLIWAILDTFALNRLPVNNPPNRPMQLKAEDLNDVILLTLGISLYVGFLMILHAKLIGIPLIAI